MYITIRPDVIYYLHELNSVVNDAIAARVDVADSDTVVPVSSTGGRLDVTLWDDGMVTQLAAFTSEYACGAFTVYDIEQAVRNDMLEKDLTVSSYVVRVVQPGGADRVVSVFLPVLFLEWRIGSQTAKERVRSGFLTSAPVTMLERGREADLSLPFFEFPHAVIPEDSELPEDFVNPEYPLPLLRVDAAVNVSEPLTATEYIQEGSRDASGVFIATWQGDDSLEYVQHNYSVGDRVQTVYVFRSERIRRLRFKNRFNQREVQHLPGVMTFRPSTEKEDAVFGEDLQDYDRDHTDEWLLESDPVPSQAAPAILAFARSREPQVWMEGEYRDIVVTEYELEHNDQPAGTVTLSCTFRLKDTRRIIES